MLDKKNTKTVPITIPSVRKRQNDAIGSVTKITLWERHCHNELPSPLRFKESRRIESTYFNLLAVNKGTLQPK